MVTVNSEEYAKMIISLATVTVIILVVERKNGTIPMVKQITDKPISRIADIPWRFSQN